MGMRGGKAGRRKEVKGNARGCEGMLGEVVDVMDEYFVSAKEDGCRLW